MTGKELIIYILSNNLEDKVIGPDVLKVMGYISKEAFSMKNGVGLSTVDTWILTGTVPFVKIGNIIYVPNETIDELRKENSK